MWVCFWALSSVPLICVSNLLKPHSLVYCDLSFHLDEWILPSFFFFFFFFFFAASYAVALAVLYPLTHYAGLGIELTSLQPPELLQSDS